MGQAGAQVRRKRAEMVDSVSSDERIEPLTHPNDGRTGGTAYGGRWMEEAEPVLWTVDRSGKSHLGNVCQDGLDSPWKKLVSENILFSNRLLRRRKEVIS